MSKEEAARLRLIMAIQMADAALFELQDIGRQLSQVTHTLAIHDQLPMAISVVQNVRTALENLKSEKIEMDSSWVRKNR